MENGFITIHRSLLKKGYYIKSAYIHLWVHLLLSANWEDREFLWNGEIQKLKPGQFITGRKALSKATGIAETTLEKILQLFEKEGQIGQQKTNKWRLITVLNWEKYQKLGQQTDNRRTTDGHLADTVEQVNNNNKENKEYRYTPEFLKFWETYPKKTGKGDAFKSWKHLSPSEELVSRILDSVAQHKLTAQWVRDGGQYVPNPSTFLNQRRWEDEVPVQTKVGSGIMDVFKIKSA